MTAVGTASVRIRMRSTHAPDAPVLLAGLAQSLQASERHDARGFGRQFRIDRYQGICLKSRHGEVFSLAERIPIVLPRQLPGRTARDSVPEQSHLHLSQSFMQLQSFLVRPLTLANLPQQQLQDFGTDRVRCDESVTWINRDAAVNDVQQGRSIDHVARHVPSVGRCMIRRIRR